MQVDDIKTNRTSRVILLFFNCNTSLRSITILLVVSVIILSSCNAKPDKVHEQVLKEEQQVNNKVGQYKLGDTDSILLPDDISLDMLWIPEGIYKRGASSNELDRLENEEPQHEVTLTNGFWMSKYEVNKAQWLSVMGTEPWKNQFLVLDEPDSPAVYVSWDDAQTFIDKLNVLTGRSFRLPTEAEWEYAARAGTTTRFYWGDDEDYSVMKEYAWFKDNAFETDEHYAHIVGQKKPNAWGLYDISGNVWEWCQDWYAYYPTGKHTDPKGPNEGDYKVLRGGSWFFYGGFSRSSRRDHYPPSVRSYEFGFRIVE